MDWKAQPQLQRACQAVSLHFPYQRRALLSVSTGRAACTIMLPFPVSSPAPGSLAGTSQVISELLWNDQWGKEQFLQPF